jgi:cyclopropane-fatty-acyl-phospholipid synthase
MSASEITAQSRSDRASTGSSVDRLARKLVFALLQKLSIGRLVIDEEGDRTVFGDHSDDVELVGYIRLHDPALFRHVVLRGSVGAGESFMRGEWSSPDLTKVVQVMVANLHLLDDMDGRRWSPRKLGVGLTRLSLRALHALRRNSREGARRNISAHYDLGNDFYELFLDPTMMYSSAIFPADDTTLEQASLYKLDTICRKLELKPGEHLVEIGSGWGGLAIHAAKHYGCRVTTVTISREQYDYAQRRISDAGLQDRIELRLCDYRDLSGTYDKLVSIEMIEAVGHHYFRTYFEKCANLLKPNGKMLLQSITIADQRFEAAKREVDFIQRYIFPGGCLPSISEIVRQVARHTDLRILQLDDLTLDYARTLAAWRDRFLGKLDRVRELGFDDIFIRMWHYYLCYCEGGFRERAIGVQQILFAKPGWRP